MMTIAGKCRPKKYVQASALVGAADLSLAPELLLDLLTGVMEDDRDCAVESLRDLRAFANRLDCRELAACCDTILDPVVDQIDMLALHKGLPALLRVWERTQDMLVDRAFPGVPFRA